MLERTVNVLGNGTLLASVSVPHGTAEKLEAWFRAHRLFGSRTAAPTSLPAAAVKASVPETTDADLSSVLIADELRKLADLRAEGILTDDEFAAQKARLLRP
jgi:hypothetical protein